MYTWMHKLPKSAKKYGHVLLWVKPNELLNSQHSFWIPPKNPICADHNKLQKTLKEMGIPDHLTCLLWNLYAGQEATVRTRHGTTDCFRIGKGVVKGVYCHPAYLAYMQSTSFETPDWRKHKLESRLPGEISMTSDMQMTAFLWQKARRN